MATTNSGKGGGKASPAALDHTEEFKLWADEQRKKKIKWNNWFPNSPKEPTKKKLEDI